MTLDPAFLRSSQTSSSIIPPTLTSPPLPIDNSSTMSPVEVAVRKVIAVSQKERSGKIDPALIQRLEQFRNALRDLSQLALKSASLNDRLSQIDDCLDDSSEELEDQQRQEVEKEKEKEEIEADDHEERLKKIRQRLIDDFPDLKLQREFFSDWFGLLRVKTHLREVSLLFMEEQIVNRCANRLHFLQNAENAIRENLPEIVKNFYSSAPIDLKEVSFKLTPQGSETHHRGKNAIKISFYEHERLLFEIFYKPRDAQIDSLVIDLFKKINELPANEKSRDVDLPAYGILNFHSNAQAFSIWQAIAGEQHYGTAADKIIESMPDSLQRTTYKQKLERLESICRPLNISDLHVENLIFTDNEIVPIDLESIQPNQATGLYEKSVTPMPVLSPKEIELIQNAKQGISGTPYRFVPISTSSFLGGLTRCDSFIDLAQLVAEEIKKKGFILTVNKEELEWHILSDFIHNDVPYFTEYKSMIYLGFPSDGKLIARR